jgi:hypothetical protein
MRKLQEQIITGKYVDLLEKRVSELEQVINIIEQEKVNLMYELQELKENVSKSKKGKCE